MDRQLKAEHAAIPQRVVAGMGWLDENVPGWKMNIDVNELDIGCGRNCVLGQIFGDYDEAAHLFLSNWEEVELGFYKTESASCNAEEQANFYKALTAEWRTAIEELFKPQVECESA